MITSVDQLLAFFIPKDLQRTTHCVCHGFRISDQDAQLIAEQLKYDFLLEHITFFECEISNVSAKLLTESLRHHPKLKQLTVTNCTKLTEQGAFEFAKLSQNSNLEKLVLINLGIRDDVARDIAESLLNNRTLKELHLSRNGVTNLLPFVRLLRTNRYIENINIIDNPLWPSQENQQQFLALLQQNREFRNQCRFAELSQTRQLHFQFHNLQHSKNESFSIKHLSSAFQQYGLNTMPGLLQQDLIVKVYFLQIIRQALILLPLHVVLNVTRLLLQDNPNITLPSSYTNALKRLNQQRVLYKQDKDEKALEINTQDRRRLSLFPLNSALVEPSSFWWVKRKVRQCADYMVALDDPGEPEEANLKC